VPVAAEAFLAAPGFSGARPYSSVISASRPMCQSPIAPARKRHCQLPEAMPGKFMRASLPQQSTSWSGTITVSAHELITPRMKSNEMSSPLRAK
jgi:hypothetical protein